VLRSILRETLSHRKIKVASIEARAKALDSLGRKASMADENDPARPKYKEPLSEVTDLSGVRVITFFPKTVVSVDEVLRDELEVIERSDKGALLRQEEKFGYQSVHYLVKLKKNRTELPEYVRFRGLVAEVQVRTVLQHAWAEIEHDIQYRSAETIPTTIRRRFMTLAGLLEIADREFQAIQNADDQFRADARKSVQLGKLGEVEVSPDALKAYLDQKLGPDGRMSDWNYEWNARLLLRLGFKNLQQVDDCIKGYDDDRVSRTIWGSRQGQLSRFEGLLLAGMGDQFIRNHQWSKEEWFVRNKEYQLQRLVQAGIKVGGYEPSTTGTTR
jgi:ppGpp synthetase/RelA/SpoT-type nucleotidyltranferase